MCARSIHNFLNFGLRLGASIIVGFVTLWTLELPILNYVLAFTLSLLFFGLMHLYASYDKYLSLNLAWVNVFVKNLWLGCISAILIVMLVPPIKVFSQFLDWCEIPPLIWLRIIASLLLTTFFPGYTLFSFLFKGEDSKFLEKIIFSVILSIFISSSIAFFGILIEGFIGSLSLFVLVLTNVVLLALKTCVVRKKKLINENKFHNVRINLADVIRILVFFELIIFILLSIYSVNFPKKLVPTIDQWCNYGKILRVLKGTFFSFVQGYYWFYLYEGLFLYASGAPPINAYVLSFILIPLPVLCFYLMSKIFYSKREALVATIIYTLFSGFGGIYASYLRLIERKNITWAIILAASKTYDISAGAVSFSFYLFPKLIGFSTFLMLTYLIYAKWRCNIVKSIIISLIFALGYLAHAAEMYIFLFLIIFLHLFSRNKVCYLRNFSYGFILGLVIIVIIDLLAPQKAYLFPYFWTGYISPATIGLFSLIVSIYLLSRLNLNLLFISKFTIIIKKFKQLSLLILILLLYFLGLCIVVWIILLPNFSIGYLGETFIWYLYPIRLGIALFMAIFGAYKLLKAEKFAILKFSFSVIFISVILERIMSYFTVKNIMQLVLFPPMRIVEFTWIGVSILATPILVDVLRCVSNSEGKKGFTSIVKRFCVANVLIMIFIIGFSSTLYNVNIRSTPNIILTDNELKALGFLENNIPVNNSLLALGYSINKINSFGVHYPVSYYQTAIFGASTFEAFTDIMKYNTYELYAHFPIKYFWLSKSDINELKKYESGYLVGHLLDYLPIVYANDEVVLYEIPSFSPPSQHSSTIVVAYSPSIFNERYILEMLALANLNYSIVSELEYCSNLAYDFLVLPCDPSISMETSYLQLINETQGLEKTIIIFNSLEKHDGFFSKLLSINVLDEVRMINGIESPYKRVVFPPIEVPLFYSNDSNVIPIAFYTMNGKPFSPYAFLKKINNFNIIYVQIYPYLEALKKRGEREEGREMFQKLGDLIEVLGLKLPKYELTSKSLGRAILYGQAYLEGVLRICPASFFIPALNPSPIKTIGYKTDYFEKGWFTRTNNPEGGNITILTGDVLKVIFNASAENVWQYFDLTIPKVNVSQYNYLILREKINTSSYNLGYLRIVIGGYTYRLRGWTDETKPPGNPWKTYIFDLSKAIPEKSDAPIPPHGQIQCIYWTGYSTSKSGGRGELYVDFLMLTSSPLSPVNYDEIQASLSTSNYSYVLIDGLPTAQKTFSDLRISSMELLGEYYNVTFMSKVAILSPPGLGKYSRMIFNNGCNLTMQLAKNSKINFNATINGKKLKITVIGGQLQLSLFPLKGDLIVYMRDAYIRNQGYSVFEKAFISWPYMIYNPGFPMTVDGMMTFVVDVMDKDFSLISKLELFGNYQVLTGQKVKWDEWDIPWLTVFASPYHIMLVLTIMSTLIIWKIKKRYSLKIVIFVR
ncbi:MAG: hypothetical protein ACTSUX_03880 [Promethearchaeota archaeon]